MSNEITAWVVSVTFHEQALTEINEVSNHFTRAGFVLTLNDEDGNPHERSSEKYAVGGRSRYNLTDMNYIFGQGSWLTDRYNGYQQRDVLTAGYGRQILNGPVP